MPDVIEKPLGVTRCIHRSATCEVWHASIRAGGKSSVHLHEHKVNAFYVVSGILRVFVDWGDGLVEIPPLRPGPHLEPSVNIETGVFHQFIAETDVELIETYTLPPIDPNDIQREYQGTTDTVGVANGR